MAKSDMTPRGGFPKAAPRPPIVGPGRGSPFPTSTPDPTPDPSERRDDESFLDRVARVIKDASAGAAASMAPQDPGIFRALTPATREQLQRGGEDDESFLDLVTSVRSPLDIFKFPAAARLQGDDKPSALSVLGAMWKDFGRAFAFTKEATGAALGQFESVTIGAGLPPGAGAGGGPSSPLPQFAEDVERLWDEAGEQPGDTFDRIAAFTGAIEQRRLERDPYFIGEKLISEMADPLILLGWNGVLLNKLGPAGRLLAPIDEKFTRITAGIVNVPTRFVRQGVTEAALAKAEGPIRVGSKAWFFQPLVTRNQAIRRVTAAATENMRVSLGGDFGTNKIGAVGERFARLVEGLGQRVRMTGEEEETALYLARIKDSMSPEDFTRWWDKISDTAPQDAVDVFRIAVQNTYSEKAIQIATDARLQRGTIGKVLAWPGAITSILNNSGYHWLSQNVLRPFPRLFLATLNYVPSNLGEDSIRSLLGRVIPSFQREGDFAIATSGIHGVPSVLLPSGKGATVVADPFVGGEVIGKPRVAKTGARRTWHTIMTPWRWYRDKTIGLSTRLTIPIQRNFYFQRQMAHIRDGWVRVGLDKTDVGRHLKDTFIGIWKPKEVENVAALQDDFWQALISGDPASIEGVVLKYTGPRVQERLVNSALHAQPTIPGVVKSPMYEWAERGGPLDELPDVLIKMKDAMLVELQASPDLIRRYLDEMTSLVTANITDIKTGNQARGLFNTLATQSQELYSLRRAITRATGHQAANPMLSGRNRTRIWEDSRDALRELDPTVKDLTEKINDLMDAISEKFPRSSTISRDLRALMNYKRQVDAAEAAAVTITHEKTIMADIAAKVGSRHTTAFWEAYYIRVEGAWEAAHKISLKAVKELHRKLGVEGDVDFMASKALASSQWEDFLARLSQLEVQIIDNIKHPALSDATAAKITGVANQLKSALGLMDTAITPAFSEPRRMLETLRAGGQFTDPITGKVANYKGVGHLANDDFKNAFTNYDDLTAVDALMTHLVPFWVYGSRATMYLGRQFFEKPKFFQMMNPWNGQFWEYTENGYIEIPLGKAFPILEDTPLESLQFSPLKSTVYGRMTNAFTRPVYDNRHEGIAGAVSKAIDIGGKAGAWPHSLIGVVPTAIEMLQGKTRPGVPSEIVPPVAKGALGILTAMAPEAQGPLIRRFFPDDFHDRIISIAMAKQGIKPEYNTDTGEFENPSHELSPAMREAAVWQLFTEQIGMFRVKPEEQIRFQNEQNKVVREWLIEIEGYTEAEVDELMVRRGGLIVPLSQAESLTDVIAVSTIMREQIKMIEGFDVWSRVNAPLTSAQQGAVKEAQRKYWDKWNDLRDEAMKEQDRDDNLVTRDPARDPLYISAEQWRERLTERWSNFANQAKGVNAADAFVVGSIAGFDGVWGLPFSEDEQNYYRQTTGSSSPLLHADDRFLNDYYQISPDAFPDETDPTFKTDWGAFHAARATLIEASFRGQPERRERVVEYMHRNETERMKEFRIGNSTFMQRFWDVDRQGMAFLRRIGDDLGANAWDQAIKNAESERLQGEVNISQGFFGVMPQTRTNETLATHRKNYRDRMSNPTWWPPGSLSAQEAEQIQVFLQKFFPGRAGER